MVLIFTIDFDTSANKIEDWLLYYRHPYIRINTSSMVFQSMVYNSKEKTVYLNDVPVDPTMVKVVYYRKWMPTYHLKYYHLHFDNSSDISLINTLIRETEAIGRFIKQYFSKSIWINDYASSDVTKINQLIMAQSVGFNIPHSILTNQKSELIKFITDNNDRLIITKSLSTMFTYSYGDEHYGSFTEIVDSNFLEKLPNQFFPSLFQTYIDKLFEVRCVFLDGELYSMAYYSQENEDCKVDWKKGNTIVSHRKQSVRLSTQIADQVRQLMNSLNLITGSLDLIYSPDSDVYFIEVNPSGIFEDVSYFGGYDIEHEFAKTLIKYDK